MMQQRAETRMLKKERQKFSKTWSPEIIIK